MSLNTSPTYLLEMCLARKSSKSKYPIFLYKFIDEKKAVKCYKFNSKSIGNKLRYSNKDFRLLCAGCELSYQRSRDNLEPFKHHLKTRRTDGFKMLSNPHDSHVPGCLPMNYEQVILKTSPVTDVVRNKIIREEDISMHRKPPGLLFCEPSAPVVDKPPTDIIEATVDGLNAVEENVIIGTNAKESQTSSCANTIPKTENGVADVNDDDDNVILTDNNMRKRLSFTLLRNGNGTSRVEGPYGASNTTENRILSLADFSCQPIKSDIVDQPDMAESDQLPRSSTFSTNVPVVNAITVKTEKDPHLYIDLETDTIISEPSVKRPRLLSDINKKISLHEFPLRPFPSILSHDNQPRQEISVRKVQMVRPMEFKKNIDAMMFNEDDADVTVEDGMVLRVVFERKTTSSDRSRTSFRLIHEFDLPDYVDRNTLQTSWCDGILTVCANTKNHDSLQ